MLTWILLPANCRRIKQRLVQNFKSSNRIVDWRQHLPGQAGSSPYEAFHGGWLSETVAEIPLWLAYLAMPVGFSLLAIQALADILPHYFLGVDDNGEEPIVKSSRLSLKDMSAIVHRDSGWFVYPGISGRGYTCCLYVDCSCRYCPFE